jgi:spore coat polysaccharide biosynthesis protein SpsF
MKIDIFVQARAGSTRLPQKVLKPFLGQPMLAFLIERLKQVKGIGEIVLATSDQPGDDAVAELGADIGIRVVRGSEDDVLSRFEKAAKICSSDVIVRVCGDNPLTDPSVIEHAVSTFLEVGCDHLSTFENHTYPYGVGCAVFSRATLDMAVMETVEPEDREHVEPYMLRAESVRTHYLCAPKPLSRPEIRLSVDYPFEFEKAERIASALLEQVGPSFTVADVIDYLDDVPLIVFANGKLGFKCLNHLLGECNEKLVGLVVHPSHESSMREEIIELSGLSQDNILSLDNLREASTVEWIRERKPEVICSFWSSFIFTPEVIAVPPRGIVNLHNSFLPWCRGSGANVWTILEECPGGVSAHYITAEVDEGGLIAQREIPVHAWDTGKTLYRRQETALIKLFAEHWPDVRVGPVRTQQQVGEGSLHLRHDANKCREIDLKKTYTGQELINLMRAFSFTPYEGCYFFDKSGTKVVMNLELSRGITTVKKQGTTLS